ncbi:MAG TPA: MotA/TolQ/ExbB proton channel family protein, partial [Prolixibacteraceae bacterium]|nr:MotA/TolQ/ExbB proton channel family protein [Prolixibacteraceae bacterium]
MLAFIVLQMNQTSAEIMAGAEGITLNFWDLALKGGWIMIPILFLSLVAVFIFGDRYIAIHRASKIDTNLMNQIRQYILDG